MKGTAGFSSVPEDRLSISFSRSSGAGGQNVNKVNTKVEVRFNLNEADWLENEVRERLRTQQASRLTRNGDIVFTSQEHRTQLLNKATAIAKVRCVFCFGFQLMPFTFVGGLLVFDLDISISIHINVVNVPQQLQKAVTAAMVTPKERRLRVGISNATKLRRKEDKRRRKEVKANRSKHRRSFDDGW